MNSKQIIKENHNKAKIPPQPQGWGILLASSLINEKSKEDLNLHPDNPLNDEEIEMVKLISY